MLLFVLTIVINIAARVLVAGSTAGEGRRDDDDRRPRHRRAVDRGVRRRSRHTLSGAAAGKNRLATVLMVVSFLVAAIPLAVVLVVVVSARASA